MLETMLYLQNNSQDVEAVTHVHGKSLVLPIIFLPLDYSSFMSGFATVYVCASTCACLLLSRYCYHQPLIQFRWICSAFYSALLWQLIDVGCSRVIFFASSFFPLLNLLGCVLFLLTFTIFLLIFIYAFWRYSFFQQFHNTRTNSLEQIDDLHCLFRLGRLQQVQTGWTFAFHARLLGTAAHIQLREEKTQLAAGFSEPFHA